MTSSAELLEQLQLPSLEELFPAGLLDGDSPQGANALRAVRVLEDIVLNCSTEKALAARHAMLQTFTRIEDEQSELDVARILGTENYLRQYAAALMPEWYDEALTLLSDEELETFLKLYLHGHEYWGHAEGIAVLVRALVTGSMHHDARVVVRPLEGEERRIPDELWSHLGNDHEYSLLGKDFVLGRRFLARPRTYEIIVGPISLSALERLQASGWAEGTRGSKKLHRLIEFAEPFYLKSAVRILLETSGFVLGAANVGKDRLGMLDAGSERTMNMLLGAA